MVILLSNAESSPISTNSPLVTGFLSLYHWELLEHQEQLFLLEIALSYALSLQSALNILSGQGWVCSI